MRLQSLPTYLAAARFPVPAPTPRHHRGLRRRRRANESDFSRSLSPWSPPGYAAHACPTTAGVGLVRLCVVDIRAKPKSPHGRSTPACCCPTYRNPVIGDASVASPWRRFSRQGCCHQPQLVDLYIVIEFVIGAGPSQVGQHNSTVLNDLPLPRPEGQKMEGFRHPQWVYRLIVELQVQTQEEFTH